MTVITLPSDLVPNSASPFLRDFGGVLTPFLGGPEQRVNRLGMRLGLRCTMPPKLYRTSGRILVSRLMRARQDRLLMKWPLLGFNPGSFGAPLVSSIVTGGTALPIKGLTAGYVMLEGQPLSVIHAGRRYMHMASGDGTANGSGNLTAGVWPPIRVSLSVNDVIELVPMIEGLVAPGEEISWQMSIDKMVDVSFSVVESA
ncbi:hypothetical protein BH10PSE12_BH10PSE12_02650 [soil metagenome]